MKKIVEILKNKNQTISCMESCTGGMLASEITNIDGSSDVFSLGLITYSNEWKEYFGVNKKIIDSKTSSAEISIDNKNALIYSSQNPISLYNKLTTLIENKKLYNNLSSSIENIPSIEDTANQILEIITKKL